ncbi:porin [Hyphomicrobium sp. LHD-15]|uniref:porin n=1 Tax=Hyphomicrobium sp. LHD-15 TaxID=3072142 RepID=UPI00280DD9FF|nr:porin [Hyphomicrobium sp. LHD-15]MDQ8698278.1 porin [Hyphomicrobium sp. LHD-15]
MGQRASTAFQPLKLVALAAAGVVMSFLPASAADFGGACCADIEERIAELEATTARKGNPKVSLTISGYIVQEITAWDDGAESNAYIHGLGPTQASHFKFNGKAAIAPGWSAGYMLRIQDLTGNAFAGGANAINQLNGTKNDAPNAQMAFWYLQSDSLGKFSVGKLANAAKSAAMFTDLSGTQILDNYTMLAGFPQFTIRSGGDLNPAGLTWGQLAYCYSQSLPLGGDCNGLVMNGVRYDSPTIGGFTVSASWGADDFWEVAGRYAGEISGFKISLGVGYSDMHDETVTGAAVSARKDSQFFQVGGYAQHIATGLFVHAAYGHEDNNDTLLLNGTHAKDGEHWYVKAGLRRAWNPLGATIVYGDYARYNDQLGPAVLALGATSSTFDRFGGGIAQEIDAASTTIYLKYQRYEANISGPSLSPAAKDLDDATFVSFGALVSF